MNNLPTKKNIEDERARLFWKISNQEKIIIANWLEEKTIEISKYGYEKWKLENEKKSQMQY